MHRQVGGTTGAGGSDQFQRKPVSRPAHWTRRLAGPLSSCRPLSTRFFTVLASAGFLALPLPAAAQETAGRADVIIEYCTECHNPSDYAGRVDFWSYDLADVHGAEATWENAIKKLRTGAMPPLGEPQPDPAERSALIAGLERELDQLAARDPDPGRSPLRRLNRAEYANAVRDLLGVDVNVSALLPPDNESFGFDNIADVLSISPILLEQYLSASAKVSSLAVGNLRSGAVATTYKNRPDLSQKQHIQGLPLGTRGGILETHYFPVDGEYQISATLSRNTVDVVRGMEEEHEMVFLIDGEAVFRIKVGGEADTGAIEENPAAARIMIDNRLKVSVPVSSGPHQVGVTFIEPNNAISDKLLKPFERTTLDPVREDGLPHLENIVITGPFGPTSPGNTASRQGIFHCHPQQGDEASACAYSILSELATRAYRRPVSDSDMAPLMRLYAKASALEGFEPGIEQAIRLIISNPAFIFRFERNPEDVAPGEIYRIDDLSLASRLSFFLWSSIPDEELLSLASEDRLSDPEILRQQIERMLADEKAMALVDNFAGQWLFLRNLKGMVPNPSRFPDYDDNLRQSLLTETELFIQSIIEEDRSVLDLLDADYSFINERLARHYDIPGIYGSRFRRVGMPPERHGLLGKGSILTVTSYATRTSPVLRGKWILSNLMGTPPSPPPPDIPDLMDTADNGRKLSVREQMARHRQNPSCASCHNIMDPLGLALENFDATGRFRTIDATGAAIDATGQLIDGTHVDGPVALREALTRRPEVFVITMTEKMLTYALGRGLTSQDAPVVREIVRQAARHDYRFSRIVEGIVESTPFMMKRKTAEPSLTQNQTDQAW